MVAEKTSQTPPPIPPPIAKAKHIVKPAEPTPEHAMYLSGCDQIAAVTHTPTVYFYRPTTTSLSEASQILRDSLSKALVIFYPIAGRVRWAEKGRVELHCNGEGVLVVEAESEATIEDYGDFIPTPEIRALIPTIDLTITPINELPLCVFQITKFRCGGICVGMGISHSVGDGQSCLHFIGEWTKIARGEELEAINKPYVDRSILQQVETLAEPIFQHPEFESPPLLIGKDDNLEERKKPTTVTMLKITKEQVEHLKNIANEDKPADDARGYSRFDGLGGHIWRSACKARGLKHEQQTRLDVPADIRYRLNPPLPKKYFGNTIVRAAAFATVGDLLTKPLSYAASRLRGTAENLTDEYIKSYLAFIKNVPDVSKYRNFHTVGCALGGFYGNPNMESTSWMGLPMYGADFGWGKEIHMGPGAVGFDGKFFVLPTRDGDGSFNVLIRLQVEHMDAFKKFFYEDM
uniref:Rosmarinic acid synthase n=1 Tax=Phacelia campanularia TaxID=79382 RepID=A0A5B8EG50_9ASTE|nr:rosmarinic acid synthase [Phacelia campanularia]